MQAKFDLKNNDWNIAIRGKVECYWFLKLLAVS